MSDAIPQYCPTCTSKSIAERFTTGSQPLVYNFICNACGTIFNDDEDYSPTDDGKPEEHRFATESQLKAVKQLAEAYNALCDAWTDDWEGPQAFGGMLESVGALPAVSLDEAAAELDNKYQDGMLLLHGLDAIRIADQGSTEYQRTDANYHYYITIHEGRGNYYHRVHLVSRLYESRYEDMGNWIADETVTNLIESYSRTETIRA